VRLISWLKGRLASLYSMARDESAAVRSEMREESGGDEVFKGSGSGSGRVSARAMLQEFAPRSRTWSKRRLMSFQESVFGHKLRQASLPTTFLII